MRAACLLCLLLLAAVSVAQPSPAEVLRGPLNRIDASQLPEKFRAVLLGQAEPASLGVFYVATFLGSGSPESEQVLLLYSLVGTSFVDPDEFAELLEGKRARVRSFALDVVRMTRLSRKGTGETPAPFFVETWLEKGQIGQWSPRPRVTREAILKVFGRSKEQEADADINKTLSNVKQASLAIAIYCADSDDVFPSADSTAKVQQQTFPYTKNQNIWKSLNPEGGRILYNTSVSGTSVSMLERPAETLLLWDEKPWPDGRRVVAFADGHAKIVDGQDWGALWNGERKRRIRARAEAIAAAEKKKRKVRRVLLGAPPMGFLDSQARRPAPHR